MSTKIVFVGGGNMALAMAGGLAQAGHPGDAITLCDPAAKRRELAAQLGLQTSADNRNAVAGADVVVLAVKPHLIAPVCRELADVIADNGALVMSVAAGVSVSVIGSSLGGHSRIVRIMPNTPALVRRGASGLYASEHVVDADRQMVMQIMESVGCAIWVEQEEQLHDVTAISGSGPAYFFLFMDFLEQEAQALGFDADSAALLVRETAAGAAQMALEADVPLAELRRRVTSPGGTTEVAIGSFLAQNLDGVVTQAVNAGRRRSVELAQTNDE
ncbi:MAG: pyrroline-5-carboxylate reductase [Gammaproteobacteria bacterium]